MANLSVVIDDSPNGTRVYLDNGEGGIPPYLFASVTCCEDTGMIVSHSEGRWKCCNCGRTIARVGEHPPVCEVTKCTDAEVLKWVAFWTDFPASQLELKVENIDCTC